MLRALLWAIGLGVFAGFLGYLAGIGLSAILGYAAGGELIVAQTLHYFGYYNASSAIQGIALNNLYQANALPYILSVGSAGVGAVLGYFKGKKEDAEESH